MTPSDVDTQQALAAIAASLNEQRVDGFDTRRVQRMVDESIGGQWRLTIDDGGGVHDQDGRRIGAIRRTPSGEWITERQNPDAERSDAAIPAAEKPGGILSKLKSSGTG